jgi:hypothetical protein
MYCWAWTINIFFDELNELKIKKGSPCAGTQGYCDVFSRCRSVNSNTVFSRLTSSILSIPNVTINDVKTWAIVSFIFI